MYSGKLLVGLLFVAVLLICFNTIQQIPMIWYIADTIYILIALIATYRCIHAKGSQKKYESSIATLLWIPAIITILMFAQDMLVDNTIWRATNMYQLIIYTLIGYKLYFNKQ